MKLNESEPLMKHRKHINAVETKDLPVRGKRSGSRLEADRTAAGVKAAGA